MTDSVPVADAGSVTEVPRALAWSAPAMPMRDIVLFDEVRTEDEDLYGEYLHDPAPEELTRLEHQQLHYQARLLATLWHEELGLPASRITGCPFDHHTRPGLRPRVAGVLT